MQQLVSVSSKNQITLPVKLARSLDIERGDVLLVRIEAGRIIMEKAKKILNELAGSLKIPSKYKGKSLDSIISESKQEYFSSKR